MKDRNYYRMLFAEELVELGKASGDELSLALAERLEEALHEEEEQE